MSIFFGDIFELHYTSDSGSPGFLLLFFFFFIGTFEANFGGILSFSCLGLDTAICPLGIGASFLCSFVFVFAGEKQ